MEVQKSKVEVWEIVKTNFANFPNVSLGGVFCLIRQKGFISWGEWYYLHGVLEKANKAGFISGKTSEQFVESIIKKLQENAKN